ncbi:alanine aminotransferase 2 [Procambarus clarkii]|uniref:alanine aminotransferase 2 n=1 Tax=Procambarus clarkii TaxID=6728 RepID=UPI001E6767FB|nr:alanine aminotransferase 2-like [Procambarus clarkii]
MSSAGIRRLVYSGCWRGQLGTSLAGSRSRTLSLAAATMDQRVISLDNMNPHVKKMEYAVRGPLVIRATALEKELQAGVSKPFKTVTKANIGDAHAMGQKPITFLRQVVSLCLMPSLMDDPSIPSDAKARARGILDGCKGSSLGSYSDSAGIEIIRHHVAQYIAKRDGFPSNWEDIILCAGASEGIRGIMKMMIKHDNSIKPGVMIPIPQYPLYSATIAEFDLHQIGYYLNESTNWGLDISELERAYEEAKEVSSPKILVVINPGNPTGNVLSEKNIQGIVKFAHEKNLFLFADEVYQDNVYAEGCKFHSFKKVIMEMGAPYDTMELASFMSCSKGYMGECGLRGGYAELINVDPQVKAMYLKSISAKLCPTTLGQAVMECVVNPPQEGEPSYDQFMEEKNEVLSSLALRAKMIVETFNSVPGMSCNIVQGAMYAFPQIMLPERAIEAAKAAGQAPDVFYAFQLLENTGICIIPGSGFGQRPGTYHFRTTILPQPEMLKTMLEKFREFHKNFIKLYE